LNQRFVLHNVLNRILPVHSHAIRVLLTEAVAQGTTASARAIQAEVCGTGNPLVRKEGRG
jgi:hypothetical protein